MHISLDSLKARIKGCTKEYGLIFIAYLFIAAVMFAPITVNVLKTIPGTGGDPYQSLWEIWWVNYALFTLHTSPYYSTFEFYPIGATLITQTFAPLASIFVYPIQLLSLPLAFNTLFFLGFGLSGLFMYLLAYEITKNKYAAFIAGTIFAFAPVHIFHAIGELNWTNVEFMPLFILLFLKVIEKKKISYAVLASVSFVFATFFGDIEQGIMLVLISISIIAYYAVTNFKMLNLRFWSLLAGIAVISLLLSAPFLIPILSSVMHGALNSTNSDNGIQYNMMYSPDILSFFVPTLLNPFLHPIASNFNSIFAVDPAERSVYIGYSVLFLFAYAVYKRRHNLSSIGLWLFIAVLFAWLSVGPYIQIAQNSTALFSSQFNQSKMLPSIYLLYHHLYLFNQLREPSRFDFITIIAIALLAAIGFGELANAHKGNEKILFIIFLLFVLVEYYGFPILEPSLLHTYIQNASVPVGYQSIGKLPGNFSVLILPALPNPYSNLPEYYPGLAMYYQTAFRKPLVGGYTTRSNTTQIDAIAGIPLADAASSLESGNGMVYYSPIIENYTNLTLLWLGEYKVAFIGIARSAYNQTELEQLGSYLYSVFGLPVYQDNSTIIFSTAAAINAKVGKSIVAYTIGGWDPGWYICSAFNSVCNSTVESEWFGNYTRGIGIIAPHNVSSVNITFNAMAYDTSSRLFVYESNITTPIAILNLTHFPRKYTIPVSLSSGNYNFIVLTSKQNYVSPYLNFGISNVTVSRTG